MKKRGVTIRRTDKNQAKIVEDLRRAGYGILDIHQIGHGAPDPVVSDRYHTILVEVKDFGGRYTPDELAFGARWPGDIITAFSARDVMAWFSDRADRDNGHD